MTKRLATSCVFAILTLGSPTSRADDLRPRGELTVGAHLYDFQSPFDDDDRTSFFDQYRYVPRKQTALPFFADLMRLDVGLVRPDDTYAFRVRRRSYGWFNDRAELEGTWSGLEFEADFFRYRSAGLRDFPIATGVGTTFASQFNDHTGSNDRFASRRTGFGGTLSLPTEHLGLPEDLFSEVGLSARYEHRGGSLQHVTVLSGSQERGPTGAPFFGMNASRWLGFEQEIDQDITTLALHLVSTPWELFLTALDLDFETFRNRAHDTTLLDVGRFDVGIQGQNEDAINKGLRGFGFIPDTDRWTGSMRVARRFGSASFHGGGFVTHLRQASNRSPEQQAQGLDETRLTTYSASGAVDVPLTRTIALGAYVKWTKRLNRNDFSHPLVGDETDATIEQYDEWRGGGELRARPIPGTNVAVGYRGRSVRRDLRFPVPNSPGRLVSEPFTVIRDNSLEHTLFAKWRGSTGRDLNLSVELEYARAPDVAYPRDFERSLGARARGSYRLPLSIPATVSLAGHFLSGDSDEIRLTGETVGRRKKAFEATRWDYNLTLTTMPTSSLALFATFAEYIHEEKWNHLRSNVRRFEGPTATILDFFLDSRPQYRSRIDSLVVGTTWQVTPEFVAASSLNLTRSRVTFSGAGQTSAALEAANEIRNLITHVDLVTTYRPNPQVRYELGYRFSRYRDEIRLESLRRSTREHRLTASVTLDLGWLLP